MPEDDRLGQAVRGQDELLADPEEVLLVLLIPRTIGADAGVHQQAAVGPVPEREPLEELQVLQREADRGLAPGHPGVEAVAAQRGRAAVQHPGLAVMAAAAEVGEAHVLVVAAQEDGRDAGALLEVHHGVNDRARVRTAVEVIADADQRVAGRGPEAREQRLELAGTAVDVADREEPARHHSRRRMSRSSVGRSSRICKAAL